MYQNKKELNAVHEKDLETLLEKVNLKADFIDRKLKCKFCGEIVDINNIYSVLPQAGMFNLICDKPDCITLLLQYMEERKKTKTEQN